MAVPDKITDAAEVILPRRVVPQPHPMIVNGGDCGACVLAGLVGWTDVARVYDELVGERHSLTGDMDRVLRVGVHRGLLDRCVDSSPQWHNWRSRTFGSPAHFQAHEWFGYVRLAIDAGYYGVTDINYAGDGIDSIGADHWVLICGYRQATEWTANQGHIRHEILVSCSASCPQGRWHVVGDFLRKHGGFRVLLARPAKRSEP